jgi:hypothetical protein
MLDLLAQTKSALEAGAYMPALMTTLTVPDICGALGSDDGRASGSKYRAWLVDWFKLNAGTPYAAAIEADAAARLYAFRCSLLHQGSSHPRGLGMRIAFIEPAPGAPQLHNLSTDVNGDVVGWISIPSFVDEMADAASRWWSAYGQTKTIIRNLERYARRRPDGLAPHVVGAAVVA